MLYSLLIALWSSLNFPGNRDIYLSVKYIPYQNEIVVTYQVPQEATLYLCDAIGVVHYKTSLSPNQKQVTLAADPLVEGPYWALLYVEGKLVTIKRLIIQKM